LARYVIDTSVVLHVLSESVHLPPDHELLAPTLIRSEVLDALYRSVQRGELSEEIALQRLARFSEMKIRYLGDKVLRRRAWSVADELGWESTGQAEYVALTQLQADALITLNRDLAAAVAEVIDTAPITAIL
jgi:indolepyruvate ferredoxin oxidoreductase alpha subunit